MNNLTINSLLITLLKFIENTNNCKLKYMMAWLLTSEALFQS
jgi:hypothetical protein